MISFDSAPPAFGVHRRGRFPFGIAGLLVAVALAASACSGSGQVEAGPTGGGDDAAAGSDADPPAAEQVVTTETTEAEEVEMPALIGLTETEARNELSGLGLDEPSVSSRESFESPGTVLEQVPTAGRVVSGSISLVVAESISPMPDFVGDQVAEVRSWAEPRGVDVRIETELSVELAGGEVVEQIPAAGAQVSQEIIVTVAETPTIVDLVNLDPVSDYFYDISDIDMNGSIYAQSAVLATRDDSTFVAFNLSRDWTVLELTLGIDDNLSANAAVQVEFKADGQTVLNETVVFGATNEVSLDVTDVLRLEIFASQIDGGRSTRVGLGDARLIGSSSRRDAADDDAPADQ